jgi:hypothetical protein
MQYTVLISTWTVYEKHRIIIKSRTLNILNFKYLACRSRLGCLLKEFLKKSSESAWEKIIVTLIKKLVEISLL